MQPYHSWAWTSVCRWALYMESGRLKFFHFLSWQQPKHPCKEANPTWLHVNANLFITRWDWRAEAYLPSNRGRMVLCWISVICSKPNSFTPFSVFSLTSSASEANEVSSNAPEGSERWADDNSHWRGVWKLRICPCGRCCLEPPMGLLTKTTTRVAVCLSWHPLQDGKPQRATLEGKIAELRSDLPYEQIN